MTDSRPPIEAQVDPSAPLPIDTATQDPLHAASRRLGTAAVWLVTVLIVAAAVVYQRGTGPTYPYRDTIDTGQGQPLRLRLLRSAETTGDALIVVPNPGGRLAGTMDWRRYNSTDAWTTVPLLPLAVPDHPGALQLAGRLPQQPPAGKLEYRLILQTPRGLVRIPRATAAEPSIVLRFKGHVPPALLLPHIAGMFLALLFGVRAGLGALASRAGWSRFVWPTFVCGTIGGMLLGPVVQHFAFNAYWTGFPVGHDLTDNKTLAQWLAWLLAAAVIWRARATRQSPERPLTRALVIVATLLMLAVYLVPHSLRGSELDYARLDSLRQQHGQDVDPTTAIGTGR